MQNYYEILEIEPNATEAQVREAIVQKRRSARARANHPNAEKRHESERLMQLIAEAEKHLLDQQSRAAYDANLQSAPAAPGGESAGAEQAVPVQPNEELQRQTLDAQQQAEQMQREMERLRQEMRRKEQEHERELERLRQRMPDAPNTPNVPNAPDAPQPSATTPPTQAFPTQPPVAPTAPETTAPEPSQKGQKPEKPKKRKASRKKEKPKKEAPAQRTPAPNEPWRTPYRILPQLERRDSDSQQLEAAQAIVQQAGAGHTREAIREAREEYKSGRRGAAIVQAYAWALLYDVYRCTYGGFAGPNPYAAPRSPLGLMVSSAQVRLAQLRLSQLKRLPLNGFAEIEQAVQEVRGAVSIARRRRSRLTLMGTMVTLFLANYLFLPQLVELLGLSAIPADIAVSVWIKDLIQVILFPYIFMAAAFPARWTDDRTFVKRAKKNSPLAPPVPWWYGVKRVEPLT
ncbi:DnaJ domain-containing protein [Rothia mucilaginosa]|uniref:DnaJ domain-containing protein n=1 Tax=Rothia mucilaginosa TaxID=43675 RepID=UPI0028DBA152|nr:DnaJ domain-containing protein [Rothia mucilaginosa]